jgi:glycosyltransferase involved in cell wall biosynthesis
MNKKSLSIVIPAYNEQDHIKDCLDAIINQTTPADEIILVDNNSTDNTLTIAKNYPQVTILHEPRQGISHAHQTGFAHARGELIARIDSDSLLPNNWVETLRNFYSDNLHDRTAFVGSGYCKNLRVQKLHTLLMDSSFIGARMILGYTPLWGPNMVVPKKCWQSIENELCEEKPTTYDDLDIALHLHDKGYAIHWGKKLRVGVRIKHLNSPRKFFFYTMRWPLTLRHHGNRRWIMAFPLTFIFTTLQYPLLYLFRKN